MSRRKRRVLMPTSSAGILRFFEEETVGIKLRPEVIIILAIATIIVCSLVLPMLFP